MKRSGLTAILVLVAIMTMGAVWVAGHAFAMEVLSLRCGLSTVLLGDTDDTVLSKCGQPDYKLGNDRWVYDDGTSERYPVIYFGPGGAYRRNVVRIVIESRRLP